MCLLNEWADPLINHSVSHPLLSCLSSIYSWLTFSLVGDWMVPWKVGEVLKPISSYKDPQSRTSFLRVSIKGKDSLFLWGKLVFWSGLVWEVSWKPNFSLLLRICSNHTRLCCSVCSNPSLSPSPPSHPISPYIPAHPFLISLRSPFGLHSFLSKPLRRSPPKYLG